MKLKKKKKLSRNLKSEYHIYITAVSAELVLKHAVCKETITITCRISIDTNHQLELVDYSRSLFY
jgi:hypothetical protein